MKEYLAKYEQWVENSYFDEAFRKELEELKNAPNGDKEIEDRFYKDLEFGTGGIRGVIGAGTNRINKYIIRKATQGFANYILEDTPAHDNRKAVIAHDNRRKSQEFALETALVFAANGIKSYLFNSLRTTPELSFAVRNLKADCGVVITASHNPPEYNGYKIYGDDGCQLIPAKADVVIEEVDKISSFDLVKYMTKEEAVKAGMVVYLDEVQDNEYLDMVESLSIKKDIIKEVAEDLAVVYSPLHGTGARPVTEILKRRGLKNLFPVEEQMVADENFSTVKSPNPEEVEAFELGIKLAKEKNADLIVATDPDSDRVGLVVKNKAGEYLALNGNQTGVLLVDYILNAIGEIPENSVVINTVVTSGMAARVAAKYGVEVQSTLTGFKFIGEKIKQFEDGSKNFIFGYEESYGYLLGTEVRDKDAVNATMMAVEMAAYYKSQNKNLLDRLKELYEDYGYFLEDLHSIALAGKDGLEKIGRIMEHLRVNPVTEIVGNKVDKLMDFKTQNIKGLIDGSVEPTGLPSSNVLKFVFENGAWFAARPSGTEPKIKFYFSAVGDNEANAKSNLEDMKAYVLNIVDTIQ